MGFLWTCRLLKLKIMDNSREKLVVAIRGFAGDELTIEDWEKIAIESNEQLIDRLVHILSYYHKEYND